jgi:hypothetical protein
MERLYTKKQLDSEFYYAFFMWMFFGAFIGVWFTIYYFF